MDALAAILIFVSVTLLAIVVVRQFDKALRLSRAVPNASKAHDEALAQVRQEIAELRSRTLRADVAELEERFGEREGGR